jgi:hypothetical protein
MLSQFTGSELLGLFCKPIQVNLESVDPLNSHTFCPGGILVVAAAATCQQVAGTIHRMPIALNSLDRMDGVIRGNLLVSNATRERVHENPDMDYQLYVASLDFYNGPV